MNRAAGTVEPRNLCDLLDQQVRRRATSCAARHRVDGAWRDVSWSEVGTHVDRLANGLLSRGVRPGDRVALFSATLLEGCIADLAIAGVGGITVPIYTSNTVEECDYALRDSGAKALFVDGSAAGRGGERRLERALEMRAANPGVEFVVSLGDAPHGSVPGIGTLAELEQEGARHAREVPAGLPARRASMGPELPRMRDLHLRHDWQTQGSPAHPRVVALRSAGGRSARPPPTGRRGVVLPPAGALLWQAGHGRLAPGGLHPGAVRGRGEADGGAGGGPSHRAPDGAAGVREGVLRRHPQGTRRRPAPGQTCGLGAPGELDAYAETWGTDRSHRALSLRLATLLIFQGIGATLRARLGGRVRLFISGSAPLGKKLAAFFELVGFHIFEGYGLTETSAAATGNSPARCRLGTAGPALPGTQVAIAADGEIVIKGPGVMKEYLHNSEATRAVLSSDGWLKTGDLGELDAEGFLRVSERKKDLIKTSSGNYVSPQLVEGSLRDEPLISQAVLHGDQRKYVTALVTVNEEAAKALLASRGKAPGSSVNLAHDADVHDAVQQAIDTVNATLPSYATIKKFRILERDLTVEAGELTPTFKVKRAVVARNYRQVLDSMYPE